MKTKPKPDMQMLFTSAVQEAVLKRLDLQGTPEAIKAIFRKQFEETRLHTLPKNTLIHISTTVH